MQKHSLIERVNNIFGHHGLGNIGVCNISKQRILFYLRFEQYRIKNPRNGKEYEFPGGTITLVYEPNSGALKYPVVMEKYTHPFLIYEDIANQPIAVNQSLVYGYDDKKDIPIEFRISRIFEQALMILKEGCDMGWVPCNSLNNDVFERYRVG